MPVAASYIGYNNKYKIYLKHTPTKLYYYINFIGYSKLAIYLLSVFIYNYYIYICYVHIHVHAARL